MRRTILMAALAALFATGCVVEQDQWGLHWTKEAEKFISETNEWARHGWLVGDTYTPAGPATTEALSLSAARWAAAEGEEQMVLAQMEMDDPTPLEASALPSVSVSARRFKWLERHVIGTSPFERGAVIAVMRTMANMDRGVTWPLIGGGRPELFTLTPQPSPEQIAAATPVEEEPAEQQPDAVEPTTPAEEMPEFVPRDDGSGGVSAEPNRPAKGKTIDF